MSRPPFQPPQRPKSNLPLPFTSSMQHLGIPLEEIQPGSRRSSLSAVSAERDGILGVSANESLLGEWLQGEASDQSHPADVEEAASTHQRQGPRPPKLSLVIPNRLSAAAHSLTSRSRSSHSPVTPILRTPSPTRSPRTWESPQPPRPSRQVNLEADGLDQEPLSVPLMPVSSEAAHSYRDSILETEIRPKGRSLFIFGPDSSLRNGLFQMHSTRGYYVLRVVLSILQVAVLQYDTIATPETKFWDWINCLYLGIYLFYTFHLLSHMVAFGALTPRVLGWADVRIGWRSIVQWIKNDVTMLHEDVEHVEIHDDMDDVDAALAREVVDASAPLSTLRSSWNRVEFASLVCFWIGFPACAASSIQHQPPLIWQMFFGLSHLRLFWLLSLWEDTMVIYHTLKVAFPMLTDVLIFMSLFAMAFTIVGSQAFSGSLDRTCVWIDPLGVANYTTDQVCGSYLNNDSVAMPYLDRNGRPAREAKGYACPIGSLCIESEGQNDGTLSFDTIFNSLEIVFVTMSTNTYSDIMYSIVGSESAAACIFFVAGVVVLNYWMLSLLVSILSSSFDIAWEARPKGPRGKLSTWMARWFHTEHFLDSLNKKQTTRARLYTAIYPLWPILIVLDVCFQAAWSPLDESVLANKFLYYWQIGLSFALLVEVAVRFMLYMPEWLRFFRSASNLLDAALAIINVSTIWLYFSSPSAYAWLTVFQLMRFYRFVALFPVAERMFKLVFGNLEQLWKLTCFYFAITYIASLMVCRMYMGQIPYEQDGEVAEVSLYNLSNAFFCMYQISSTENWTAPMYYIVQNASGVVAQAITAGVFSLWLAFSNFIVVNLFIAVMSSRFTTSKANMRREQVLRFVNKDLRQPVSQADRDLYRSLKPRIKRFIKDLFSSERKPAKQQNPLEQLSKLAEKELLAEFLELSEVEEPQEERPTMFSFLATNMIIQAPIRLIKRTLLLFDRDHNYNRYVERHERHERGRLWVRSRYQRFRKKAPTSEHDSGSQGSQGSQDDQNSQDESPGSPESHSPPSLRGRTSSSPPELSQPSTYVDGLLSDQARTRTEYFERSKTYPKYDRSLGIFGIDSKLRRLCQRIVPSNRGERASGVQPHQWVWTIFWTMTFQCSMAVVIISCINTPIYHIEHTKNLGYSQSVWTWITYLDLVFACIFFVEFLIKVIADGFHFTPNAYTYSPWNLIDLLVLASMMVTIVNNFVSGPVSRYSRAIMAFRALRLISVTPKSEQVFTAVFFSGIGRIIVAAFIGLGVVFPYSVWGLNLFHNKLAYCSDGDVNNLNTCYNEYLSSPSNWDVWAPRYKTNPYFDYDSFGQAMLIQFGVLSLEGWVDVLNAVISIQGSGVSANSLFSYNYNALYPILYNFLGTVLIMTMFLSTIIRNYARSRVTAFLTSEQLTWHYMKRSLRQLRPKVKLPVYKPGTVRFVLLQAINNPRSIFSILELGVVALLTLVFFIYHHDMSQKFQTGYYYVVAILALANSSLLFIRLWILGWSVFKKDRWNIYATIVSLNLSAFTLALIQEQGFLTALQRAFTLLAVGLWIAKIPTVRRLFHAATENKAELATITNTYGILFLTFAIAFNQTFGLTKFGESGDMVQNFRTVPSALILLFKMSTGEGWNQILVDYTVNSPYCTAGDMFFDSDCGSKAAAYVLFIAWNLISMYVFANLFISVIYDTFWYLYRRTHISVTSADLRLFQANWQRYDPQSRGYIYAEDLYSFLRTSRGYFSLGIYSDSPDYNLRAIIERSQCRRSLINPYDVDTSKIWDYLAPLDVQHYVQKRRLFELFCLQALYNSRTGQMRRKIKFQRLLLQFPLYKDMDPAKVMELTEFVELKVELYQLRLVLAANFIAARWRLRKQTYPPSVVVHPSED